MGSFHLYFCWISWQGKFCSTVPKTQQALESNSEHWQGSGLIPADPDKIMKGAITHVGLELEMSLESDRRKFHKNEKVAQDAKFENCEKDESIST